MLRRSNCSKACELESLKEESVIEKILDMVTTDVGNLNLLGKGIYILLIIVVVRILLRIIRNVLRRFAMKHGQGVEDGRKYMTFTMIGENLFKYLLYFIAIVLILDQFGVNTTSIIATAGIGGIAIAFGAQSLVKDVITGAFIILEDQYGVGDQIQINTMRGEVVAVGLRMTKLLDYSGAVHFIPNGTITSVTNFSKTPQRATVVFGVAYDTDRELVKQVAEEICSQLKAEETFLEEPTLLGIKEMNPYSYTWEMTCRVAAGGQFAMERKMRGMIVDALKENRIDVQTLPSLYREEVQDEKI